MDPYFAFLLAGCAGLTLMAALGAAGNHGHDVSGHSAHGAEGFHLHGTGGHGHHLHSDTSFHHAPAAHGVHGHAAAHGHATHGHGNHQGHAHGQNGNSRETSPLSQASTSIYNLRGFALSWLSPRVLFTLAMGSGATGLCLASVTSAEPLRGLLSLAGGIALEKIVVAPLWSVLTRFASSPARTLESAVFEEAVAITSFDAEGCGVVSVTLDGHEMRLLGRLNAENRTRRVRSGEALLIESVDGARGQCVVSPVATEHSPPN